MRILLTGASGFVGRAVQARLLADPRFALRSAFRRHPAEVPAGVDNCCVAGLGPDADWQAALLGVGVVIHCAARVHVMRDDAGDPLAAFRRTNVLGTLQLARQATLAGVRRFVYLSSIKVNGEETKSSRFFTADDRPAAVDPYGISKFEAEQELLALAAETGMEVVIIRPPLVYGPGVKANFLTMMRWLYKGVPLPFGAIPNKRSFVALDNLVDLIVICVDHPAAGNQTFLVSDGEDISTSELLQRMGLALGKPARLLPVPVWMLESAAALLGKRGVSQRLCGSLQVDIAKTKALLNWAPPASIDAALDKTAKYFLEHQAR